MPGWSERLEAVSVPEEQGSRIELPRSPDFYRGKVTFVEDTKGAEDMLALTQQLPLSHIGIDTEFQYSIPGWQLNAKTQFQDVRSVVPLLLSITLVEPKDGQQFLYNFVVDLRQPGVAQEISPLFRLSACFVGHNLKVEWFCLWQLGIEPPANCWDTFIAEKARYQGIDHRSYKQKPKATELEKIQAKEIAEEAELYRMDLVTCCRRYGIQYQMASEKSRLQKSFLIHGADQPFSQEQIDYAAKDAIAAASLYFNQILAASQHGLLKHLIDIEMPWVTTNARMIWNGLRVNTALGTQAQQAAAHHAGNLNESLSGMGLANVNSHPQLIAFFDDRGLLHHFAKEGGYSFDKEMIKANRDLHPSIQLIHELRKAQEWENMQLLNPGFTGDDHRIHPDYAQLGASTGRQTCRHPNVLALSRLQRNLIIPAPGHGIGEVDLSQIEPGIAGAVYQDDNLIELFNTGDVYSAMAQMFFVDELDEAARHMPSREFKAQFGDLRKQMKSCTLGIIYGLSPHGLAGQLKTSEIQAADLLRRFKEMFPALLSQQAILVATGQLLGYSSTTTGLRRYRGAMGKLSNREKNWMINHPVQGTAAALFKAGGNRLDRQLQRYQAHLLIPLHDSYIFEAPLEMLETVGNLIAHALCDTVQQYFPELKPNVDINIEQPECWNKDGDHTALDRWIDEVTANVKA